MQIVIDVTEEYYNVIKAIPDRQCTADMLIIKRGTPLPKGHGRLIDEDALEIRNITMPYGYDWECGENTYTDMEIVRADDIWNAQTIIEADRKSQE